MHNESECRELNKRKWDSLAAKYGRRFGKNNFFFLRWFQKKVLELVDLPPDVTFLDIACGTGWAVRYAAARAAGGKFYGIDLSPKMIEVAKENSAGFKNVQFMQAGVEKLPFEADFFDVIICTNAFHHFPDPAAALHEAYRVLKPKGRLYIVDPTTDSSILRFIDRLAGKMEKEHVKEYSSEEYRSLFTQAHLAYVGSRKLFYPEKIHMAEKSA
jgi:ubiquinone/menaquinone biosynthesis C-methylase UbiE